MVSTEKSQVRKTFSARSRRAIKLSAISTETPLSGQYKDHQITSISMCSVWTGSVSGEILSCCIQWQKMALTVNTHHLLWRLKWNTNSIWNTILPCALSVLPHLLCTQHLCSVALGVKFSTNIWLPWLRSTLRPSLSNWMWKRPHFSQRGWGSRLFQHWLCC